MKRTKPDQVFAAVLVQCDALGLDQGHQINAALNRVDIFFGDAPGKAVSLLLIVYLI